MNPWGVALGWHHPGLRFEHPQQSFRDAAFFALQTRVPTSSITAMAASS
jgi:hypothetical protein